MNGFGSSPLGSHSLLVKGPEDRVALHQRTWRDRKTTSAFRSAYQSRRCLVPAEAFFEWQKNGKAKQPHAIALRTREFFAFAGLWENWMDPKTNEWLRTFTILTTQPNDLIAPIHDRMPVILAPDSYDRWLRGEADPGELIRPYPADEMITSPVSVRVNTPKNDDSAILDPVEDALGAASARA
jgi:putative SOS response-associated peptidase YedK